MTKLTLFSITVVAGYLLFGGSPAARPQLLPAGTTSVQQEQPAVPTLKVSARIVVLDIVVTDSHGQPISKPLSKDDFEVFEDDQPQRIRNLESPKEHQLTGATVNSAGDLRKIGDAPVTVMVLDELDTRFEDMSYAREMTIKYLQAQPKVLPQPTLLLAATNARFIQLHDWTQNLVQPSPAAMI